MSIIVEEPIEEVELYPLYIEIDTNLKWVGCEPAYYRKAQNAILKSGSVDLENQINQWVELIEKQINLPEAKFSFAEKLVYLNKYFDVDLTIPRRALDIVRSNLVKRS